MKDALIDLSQCLKDFDASTLVQGGWLDKPHVLLAVLHGYAFLLGLPTGNFLEPIHQKAHFVFISDSGDKKGCRCRIKNRITCSHGRINRQIVLLQGQDQASFCSDPSRVLKVIQKERLGCSVRYLLKPVVYLVIRLEVQIGLSPVKVTRLNSLLLWHLAPIAAGF